MNKAKMMLSALGVLAVIGSALAFKAHTAFSGNLRCATSTTGPGAGPIPGNLCTQRTYVTTIVGVGPFRHCTHIWAPTSAPCVVARVTINP